MGNLKFCLISLIITSSVVAPAWGVTKDKEAEKRYKNLELFQKVLSFVESNFVDEIDNATLIQGAIKGMLQTLDPHSNFLTSDIFRDMKIDTTGQFGGLGVEIGVRDNVLTVITPIEGSPAARAGIKPGDRIVKIGGQSTKGLTLAEAISRLRGKNGMTVVLTIFRSGFEKAKDFTLKRETVEIKAVPAYRILEPQYGYLRLQTFNENATRDVGNAIESLQKSGNLKGLVLDLRTNPGGLLDQAVDVASLFLQEGVVVSTIGRNKEQKEVRHVKGNALYKNLPLAILVSPSTASAAEIVAGALQDHHRAVILGQPTFGKGSVQTVIELGNDLGLKLTIARYFTPKGRSIQEKGVVPDIMVDQYDNDLLKKARIKQEILREKDLPGHIIGQEGEASEFSDVELQSLVGGEKNSSEDSEIASVRESKDSREKDAWKIKAIEPHDDYQVKQAVNYLKSFAIFKGSESRS